MSDAPSEYQHSEFDENSEVSDLEDIKEDLINSIELNFHSAPVSPIFDLLGSEQISAVSRSAPPSPRLRRGSLPSISVRNLISNFEQNHSV